MGIIDKLNSVDTSLVSDNNEYMENRQGNCQA